MKKLAILSVLLLSIFLSSCSKDDDTPKYPTSSQQEMLEMFQGKYAEMWYNDVEATTVVFDPPFAKPQKMVWSLWGVEHEIDIHGTYTVYFWYDENVKYYYAYSLDEKGHAYTQFDYENGKISEKERASIVIGKDKKSFTWYWGISSLPHLMKKRE